MPQYPVEPLGKHHNRAAFSCGVEALDAYLQQHARRNVEQRIAAVFVLVDIENNRLIGYYSLSSGSVDLQGFPENLKKKLPRYPVPIVLLGRLAIDVGYQKQHLGEALLVDALKRAFDHSHHVGAMAVVVDAKGDQARAFYERYGFQRFVDDEYRLFIPMTTIAQLIEER